MSTITKIEKQKKNQNRFSIFLDGEFAFGLSEDVVLRYGLKKNQNVDDALLAELQEQENYNKQWNYALLLLSYGDRTISEIKQRLKKREVSNSIIEKIVEKLKDYNLLNDENYVKRFLQSKEDRGYYYFYHKFITKGLDPAFFVPLVKLFFEGDEELNRALKVGKKKLIQLEKYSVEKQKEKLLHFLKARGFSNHIMFEVVRNLVNTKQNYE